MTRNPFGKYGIKIFSTNVNSSCCVDGNLTNTDITNNFKVVFENFVRQIISLFIINTKENSLIYLTDMLMMILITC